MGEGGLEIESTGVSFPWTNGVIDTNMPNDTKNCNSGENNAVNPKVQIKITKEDLNDEQSGISGENQAGPSHTTFEEEEKEVFVTPLGQNEACSSHTTPQEVQLHFPYPIKLPFPYQLLTPSSAQNEVGSSHITQEEILFTPASAQNEAKSSHIEAPLVVPSETSGTIFKREIVKSILYGGLEELIVSLGIITSASTTSATTGKIVALSLATLITGLFVKSYKILELWMNKHQSKPDKQAEEEVDQYEESLGNRQNYRLHSTVAILSFLIFGLVPPLVYGFTFRKPEDKILKVPAVTAASVVCIAILGVGKAYVKREENCLAYVYVMGGCVVDAVGASALTTLGGDLIGKYIEQNGWFEPNKRPTISLPGFGFENRTWGSF